MRGDGRGMSMKRAVNVAALVAMVVGIAFYLGRQGSEDGGGGGRSNPASDHAAASPRPDVVVSEPVHPVLAARPNIEAARPDFDRSPRHPHELESVYERRMRVAEAFDRFRAETGISDQKAQALLQLMHDYQENFKVFHREWEQAYRAGDRAHESFLYQAEGWRDAILTEKSERLLALLTGDEWRVWVHTVEQANPWVTMRFQPLIRLTTLVR